jgi:chorismate mutase/prephenate dehydratase
MPGDDNRLRDLRDALDAVDDEILDCLNRRARLVQEVADFKQARGVPFYVPDRERGIIERLTARNTGPFPSGAIRPVVQEIISACLTLETGLRVAYLGPEGTFSHQAVKLQFGTSARPVPSGTIAGVFEEVERGRAHYGVVPVENSSEGIISHTLDSFIDSDLSIIGEVLVVVSHSLLARHDVDERQIERVYSHPQALAQCRQWLSRNLPRAALVESASTTDAARAALADAAGASIGAALAARMYDLRVLRGDVQDMADNRTRFLVIGTAAERPPASGNDTTSILMVLPGDRAGALFRALEPMSSAGINLTKIESRPSRRRAWEYVFFVDLDGHVADSTIASVLERVAESCELFKILGSYPKSGALAGRVEQAT